MDEYPSDTDFQVFVEEKFGRDKTQRFLRDYKNFLVHTNNKGDVADISRRILFGYEETNHLKEGFLAERRGSEKSTAFTFRSDADDDDLESDLTLAQTNETVFHENKDIKVKDTTQTEDGIEVDIEYNRLQPTRRSLMDKTEKETSIVIEETGEEDVRKVSQDYQSYDEFNAVKDFFEGWKKDRIQEDKDEIQMGDIILERLDIEDRVSYFEDILSAQPGNWRLDDTLQLGIRQADHMEEMFEEAEGEEDIRELIDDNLRGITEAVIKGEGLMGNDFVQTTIENGYYFNSGKLEFTNTDVAKKVEVLIEFKQKPKNTFDVSIKGEYEITGDGDAETTSFDPEFRKGIRDTFRDLLIDLYGDYVDMPNLIKEKHEPQELTDLPNIGDSTAENLRSKGFESIDDVLSADRDALMEVEGVGESTVEELLGSEED